MKIAYFNGENPSNFSKAEFHFKFIGLLLVKVILEKEKLHF